VNNILIVTGVSGAGKSSVVRFLEDLGYYCVDNMPPVLLMKFAELCLGISEKSMNVAFVMDIRGGKLFQDLFDGLRALKEAGYKYEILYLEASDDVLVARYKESRRKHPLQSDDMLIIDAIRQEKEILQEVKKRADHLIDTSNLSQKELKTRLYKIFKQREIADDFILHVVSFGFKYGILTEADLVFDVRFLPNPFYIDELRAHTGKDEPVAKYVMSYNVTQTFVDKLMDMLLFLLPNYIEEGKSQLIIGIGCTGGKHRSVAIAEEVNRRLNEHQYYSVINHRDIEK
jgi:UPF0042 nucleotide-binding protein